MWFFDSYQEGTRANKMSKKRKKKKPRKSEGPKASHQNIKIPGMEHGAVAQLVSKEKLTWNASQEMRPRQHGCSATG
jgi:hypothetical protein